MGQMEKFGESLRLYANGLDGDVVHYPGPYTKAMALDLAKTVPLDAPVWMWAKFGGTRMAWTQMQDLALFGVRFDTVSRESHLHHGPMIDAVFENGDLWESGVDGPICGCCGSPLEWLRENGCCKPCPMCSGGWMKYEQPWFGFANPLSSDPALSKENDFMPEMK